MLIHIDDPADPRVAPYRDIKERDLTGRRGLFIAEGEVVLRTLASPASRCQPLSLLLAKKRVAALTDVIDALPADTPTYVASQEVLDTIAGFALHRGMLGIGQKPEPHAIEALLDKAPDNALVLVACGIGNHDNMGGLFRNAAAFGAHVVLLDDQCCDPFYRKAIRVSVGAVLRTLHGVAGDSATIVDRLQTAGFEVLALSPSSTERLCDVRPAGRVAIVVGAEGPGLDQHLIAKCRAVGIPMSGGFDSLNVAATSAIALHHLTMSR